MAFPQDFEIPQDQGGPGQGQPIGGFGGHPSRTRDQHRTALQGVGKAPVILLHGNSGSADSGRWNTLDLQQMLIKAAYPRELIWAPSYLGTGTLDLLTPHTNNVNEVRAFIDNVCEYLDVRVVDIIAHSLGCSLAYALAFICHYRSMHLWRVPVEPPLTCSALETGGALIRKMNSLRIHRPCFNVVA